MLLSLFVNVRLLIKFNLLCSEKEKRFCFVCLLNKNVWQIIIFSQRILIRGKSENFMRKKLDSWIREEKEKNRIASEIKYATTKIQFFKKRFLFKRKICRASNEMTILNESLHQSHIWERGGNRWWKDGANTKGVSNTDIRGVTDR